MIERDPGTAGLQKGQARRRDFSGEDLAVTKVDLCLAPRMAGFARNRRDGIEGDLDFAVATLQPDRAAFRLPEKARLFPNRESVDGPG